MRIEQPGLCKIFKGALQALKLFRMIPVAYCSARAYLFLSLKLCAIGPILIQIGFMLGSKSSILNKTLAFLLGSLCVSDLAAKFFSSSWASSLREKSLF